MTVRLCVMFPGQGSQHPGMGRDLYRECAEVRESVDAASKRLGRDLVSLMGSGTAEELARTDVAQVAVFALSVGIWRHIAACGVTARMVLGHSAGEYAALVAAGVLDHDDALTLIAARGRAMADACEARPGGMVALGGISEDRAEAICAEAAAQGRGVVVVANRNAHIQTVLSGDAAAVDVAAELARRHGAPRVVHLSVGGAFHSPLMTAARDQLEPLLRGVPMRTPGTIFVSSVTGAVVDDVEAYRERLVEQIVQPVQWTRAMATARLLGGGGVFVEVGPGRVLSGLAKSNNRSTAVAGAGDVPSCARLLRMLRGAPAAVAVLQ